QLWCVSREIDAAYSFGTRFGSVAGTNPEELLGAAHAGCFSMALSHLLGEAGLTPQDIHAREGGDRAEERRIRDHPHSPRYRGGGARDDSGEVPRDRGGGKAWVSGLAGVRGYADHSRCAPGREEVGVVEAGERGERAAVPDHDATAGKLQEAVFSEAPQHAVGMWNAEAHHICKLHLGDRQAEGVSGSYPGSGEAR